MSSETDKYKQGVLLIETALERLAAADKDDDGELWVYWRKRLKETCKSLHLEPGLHLFETGTLYVTRGGWGVDLTGIDRAAVRYVYNLEGGDPVKDTWCHFPSWE